MVLPMASPRLYRKQLSRPPRWPSPPSASSSPSLPSSSFAEQNVSFSSIHDHAEDEDNNDDYLKDGDDYDVYDVTVMMNGKKV